MDKYKEKCKLFWQQYNGLVRAIDLPQWYKIEDERIACVNCDCFFKLKEKCLFWQRYTNSQLHFSTMKQERRDIIKYQNNGIKRNDWDNYKDKPHYFLASFYFSPEKNGVTCDYFTEKS